MRIERTMIMPGNSGRAVAAHTLIVKKNGQNLAVTPAQLRLLRRAQSGGGGCYARGAEVRTARASSLFGTLRDDGSFSTRSTNGDGERWWFSLSGPIELPTEQSPPDIAELVTPGVAQCFDD